jgi:DNA invertase Pin-like site-specific DNA recombinase
LFSAVAAGVVMPGSQGNGRPRKRSEILAERRARAVKTAQEIDRLIAEAHAKLPRHLAKTIGAIYARFSTWFQDSAEDQVRTMLEYAVANGIFVPREHVYFDLGVRGHKNEREGLDQLRKALRGKQVKVFLLFATNRLFRKVFRTLEFVEEVVTERKIRCVFVKSGIDTANKDQWQALLHVRAMMDEFQVKVNGEHIRAALEGLFLEALVYGTLTFGYRGEPVPGQFTNRGRPRCRIVIDDDEAKIVLCIFEWFVDEGLSLIAIAQRLNAIEDVAQPRKSNGNGWNDESVRAVLKKSAYRGLWEFSITERTFLPSKDYTRQVLREEPLRTATFERLRIVSDKLWFAAQARLGKNKSIRGRRSEKGDSDTSDRILSGLLWCPEHERPLRAYSAFGRYLACPLCAMLSAESRPLFSKPARKVVLQLLCRRLAELIKLDADLIDKVIAAAQARAAAVQRPDASELKQLERKLAELGRRIQFNMNNPGETEEDEQEIAQVLRALRQERRQIQDEVAHIKASELEPIRVPTSDEIRSLIDDMADILQRSAACHVLESQDVARDILQSLTGGRIDVYQQGERKEMQGWLQGRFTVSILDIVVERLTGVRSASDGQGIEVCIDFKRPRKSDSDADEAIRLWLQGQLNREVGTALGVGTAYVTRLLKIGAERMGTTLDSLQSQRKSRPVNPDRMPGYERIADDAKRLWWNELYPLAAVARKLSCSTVTIDRALRYWFEYRELPVPRFADWQREQERRTVTLFEQNDLTVQEIACRIHVGGTQVKKIVRRAYKRIGKSFPNRRLRPAALRKDSGAVDKEPA